MNVFVVEDSATLLEKLLSALHGIPGIAVIGHAMGEAGAIKRIDALRVPGVPPVASRPTCIMAGNS